MEYKWELHVVEPGVKSRDRIRVTISRDHTIYLNPVAIKALGDPDAVQLMFDRKQSVIGILRTSIEKKGAYRLQKKAVGRPTSGRYFYAVSFCRKFKIHPKETTLFTDAQINRDGILILDLNQVVSAKKKNPDPEA